MPIALLPMKVGMSEHFFPFDDFMRRIFSGQESLPRLHRFHRFIIGSPFGSQAAILSWATPPEVCNARK
jgi:hypothetical protein